MEKIILSRVVCTKNNKTMLVFLKGVSSSSTKVKGYNENIQWFDDLDIFNKLEQSDFGVLVDAELGYSEPNYQGLCTLEIKQLISKGRKII